MSNIDPENFRNPNDQPDVEDFMRDAQEKRKLLERWAKYFPHEQ